MQSPEQIEAYRRMSQRERWRIVEQLMDIAWDTLKRLPHEEAKRRLEIDRQRHEESDRAMLEHLRRVS